MSRLQNSFSMNEKQSAFLDTIFSQEEQNTIDIAFQQIEITEDVIGTYRENPNFELINASLKPYWSEILITVPDIIFKDHAQEIAKRLSALPITSTKGKIESSLLPPTDAELAKTMSNVSLKGPMKYEYTSVYFAAFSNIFKRQHKEIPLEISDWKVQRAEFASYDLKCRSIIKCKERVDMVWGIVQDLRKDKVMPKPKIKKYGLFA